MGREMNSTSGSVYWESGKGESGIFNLDELYFTHYEKKARSLDCITIMKDHDVVFNKNTSVIELGCGPGRNLYLIEKLFGCCPWGIDIYQSAVDSCKNYMPRGFFKAADLALGGDALMEAVGATKFNVGITMGFLMHVPITPEKKSLIKTLLDICDFTIMIELSRQGDEDKDELEKNGCVLTTESYTRYDERIQYTGIELPGKLAVYICDRRRDNTNAAKE